MLSMGHDKCKVQVGNDGLCSIAFLSSNKKVGSLVSRLGKIDGMHLQHALTPPPNPYLWMSEMKCLPLSMFRAVSLQHGCEGEHLPNRPVIMQHDISKHIYILGGGVGILI